MTGKTNPSLRHNEKQMESALRLRCYTLPRTPLHIPSSLHAANLQFSFRHFSFSPGKGSRSYPSRQILGPITCAVGGFRTPSRHNKANDHNMAKRVGRASFTLACVIGIIGCSLWLKQEVIAAPDVGKVSSQMESTALEGVSKKPDSATKANPRCKCLRDRRIVVQMGSESSTNENLQKPISEVPAPVPQALDKVEDPPQSKLEPQQTPSPPQGGERDSSSSVSQESLLSEDKAEKHLNPEPQGKISDIMVPLIVGTVTDLLQSKLVPQKGSSPPQGGIQDSSSSVSRESLLSEDKAEKQLKPELQGKTSDVKVPLDVGKVEDLPQSQLVPQQTPSTVSQTSSFSEDRKPEAQEELQGKSNDVKVDSSTSGTHFSPSQSPQIDLGVDAVNTPSNKGSLPSPLVSITFKVDPSTMPSLAFVSPSTSMPMEPRLRRSKSDRGDGTKVLVQGVPVSPSIAPMVEQIFAEHGDVTANCLLKDQAFRADLVEGLVTVMQILQEYPARKLTNDDFTFMYRKLEDLERVKVNVRWLREQIEALGPFLNVVESTRKWETMVAEVGKMGAELVEQDAKLARHEGALARHEGALAQHERALAQHKGALAQHEGALAQHEGALAQHEGALAQHVGALAQHEGAVAQKPTDIAEFETQGTKDLRREEDGLLYKLGILLNAFGFGTLFYLFFVPK